MRMLKLGALLFVLLLSLSLLTACGGPSEGWEEDTDPQDAETEEHQETESPEQAETEPEQGSSAPQNHGNQEALTSALNRLETQGIWPDGRPVEYAFLDGPTVTDRYAIADVDGDGREELILSHENDVSAARFTAVYGWDGAETDLREELSASPGLTFYENGRVQAPWSHHQLPAVEEPYTLFRWNAGSDTYQPAYQVSSWNRERMEAQHFPDPYPEEADVSGSGTVYFLDEVGSSSLGKPVDVKDFQAFERSWKGNVIPLDWKSITVPQPSGT